MGLEPPYLADRQHQLIRFIHFLEGFPEFPRNLRITGLRGVGKTVLLLRLTEIAESRGWVVVRRELGEHMQDELAFGLALVDDCRRAVEAASRRAGAALRAETALHQALDLLGGISVSLAGISISLRSPSGLQRPRPVLEDELFTALETTSRVVRSVGRQGVVLSYDEAHVLRDSRQLRQHPLGALLAAVARAQREHMPVMLLVCGLPSLTENLALAKSYSERMFQAEVLHALQPPEDVNAFARPFAESRRSVELAVVESVRAETKGYPFHVQFFGALLWDAITYPEPVTEERFRTLRPAIVDALDHAFFDARLARTSRLERSVLAAMAAHGESADLSAVLKRTGFDHDVCKRLAGRLVAKGLVYRPERGRLAFSVPLFGDYLRRKGAG